MIAPNTHTKTKLIARSASCGVCVSRLVRFARVSGRVGDFGARSGFWQ